LVVSWVRGVEMEFESVEPISPDLSKRGEPGLKFPQWLGAQAIEAPVGVSSHRDKSSGPERFEMLRNGRLADVEKFNEFAGGPLAVTEHVEDLTSVGLY
jgi:hypothetical protein